MKHSVGQCLPPIITYRCGFTDTNKHKAKRNSDFGFYRQSCHCAGPIISKVVANSRDGSITAASLHMQLNDWFVTRNSDFGFYRQSCHCAGPIISKVVANSRDGSITAASLHMQLNDWFVTVRKFSFVTAASVHMQLNLYGVKNNDYKNSLRVLQEMKNQIKTHYFSATILDGVHPFPEMKQEISKDIFVSGLTIRSASRPQILRPLASSSIEAIETNLLAALSVDEEIKICFSLCGQLLRSPYSPLTLFSALVPRFYGLSFPPRLKL
ncbi:hypothetical protein DY000_02023019 [Brassica cretica]|uniref:Uncharacterized protein n=1 Tax=Brassica cretica TaxID=69181 RepID=A0ABQ7E390_BRACR|nr:hypothetical protein DY000_02023019 [Brassica cretica]